MPDPLDPRPYQSAAATLYAAALAVGGSPGDVAREWWRLYDNATGFAEIMAALDLADGDYRSYRVRDVEIVSCEAHDDGQRTLVWRETDRRTGELVENSARLGGLHNPAYRLVVEMAEVCITQGLRANLLCGYEPNTRGWSSTEGGRSKTPDYFRRVFRVQPLRRRQDPAPAPTPAQAPVTTEAEAAAATAAVAPTPPAPEARHLAPVPDAPTDEELPPGPFGPLLLAIADAELSPDTKIADTAFAAEINSAFAAWWGDLSAADKNAVLNKARGEYQGKLTKAVRPVTLRDLAYFDEIAAKVRQAA